MSEEKLPEVKCFTCKGEGLIEERKCGYCKGTGKLQLKIAESVGLEYLSDYTDRILEALEEVTGINTVFATDETAMSDFFIEEDDLKKISEILGVEVKDNDLLFDIAKRMKNA
jgi:DnaJ-class molecular chaperone